MSWIWYRGKPERGNARAWGSIGARSAMQRLEYLYDWERRCRGYDLFPHTVALEPPYVPYTPNADREDAYRRLANPALPGRRDDDDSHGSGHTLAHLLLRLPLEQKVTPLCVEGFLATAQNTVHPLSFEIIGTPGEIAYQLTCHRHEQADITSALQMHFPLADITARFGRQSEASSGQESACAHSGDTLRGHLAALKDELLGYQVVDFGLYHPVYQPLKLFGGRTSSGSAGASPAAAFPLDPLSGVVAALSHLQGGEVAGLQVLFTPARSPWSESLQRVVAEFREQTHSPYPHESELEKRARLKLSTPLWATVIRAFAVSVEGDERALHLCRRIGGALSALGEPGAAETGGNALFALDNHSFDNHSFETQSFDSQSFDNQSLDNDLVGYDDNTEGTQGFLSHSAFDYAPEAHLRDVLARQSHRVGMLLATGEMLGLVHPPTEKLSHPKLLRLDPLDCPLPAHLSGEEGATLGLHTYRGGEQNVVWPDRFRTRHAYILGATRMGKSTLLLNLIAQDIQTGKGLCLIDPHGDLALDVLARIPLHRQSDVLYLDCSDGEHPPSIGLLEAHDEWEKRLLVSDVLSILRRLFAASWGDRLEHILRHVLLTLLADASAAASGEASMTGEESTTGEEASAAVTQGTASTRHAPSTTHTLRDIRPLLASKAFREKIVAGLSDPELRAFWKTEFPGYSPSTLAPLYNKLGLLLSSPVLRNIVVQRESRLHFPQLMHQKKVLLVNLAGSRIGEDNAHFLGALLVSKLQIAAMQSLRSRKAERAPFTLYVDEFQHFVVSSFEKILSEAGKAGLSLVMANQYLEQLGAGLQTAILSNAGTLVSFRVSAESARGLEMELAGRFAAQALTDLGQGQAIVRLGKARDSFRVATLPPPPSLPAQNHVAEITQRTRRAICRPRAAVEARLARETAIEEPTEPERAAAKGSRTPARTSPAPAPASAGSSAGSKAEEGQAPGVEGQAHGADHATSPDEPAIFDLVVEDEQAVEDEQVD
jgi:hypothetical protein